LIFTPIKLAVQIAVTFFSPFSMSVSIPDWITISTVFFFFLCWYYKDTAIGASKCPTKNCVRMRQHLPIIGSLRTALLLTDRCCNFNYRSNERCSLEFERLNDTPMTCSLPFQPAMVIINDPPSIKHMLDTNFDNYIKGPKYYENFRQVFG
jgi:hypothetical protein